MKPPTSIFDSPRLAVHYAYDRPPVHRHIIRAICDRLDTTARLGRALDIGCGAGLSSAALEPLAEIVVGIEPVRMMLTHRHAVAPRARFVVGQGERLPFSAAAFDLITAAGSINYADPDRFLAEAARVLAPCGTLVLYDFSAGRRLRAGRLLEDWCDAFETRYPPPPGYALDVRVLDYGAVGLRLEAYEQWDIAVPMNLASYLAYALGEMNVESAIERGAEEGEIRDWCERTLADVFGAQPQDVLFDSHVAYITLVRPNGIVIATNVGHHH